MNEKKYGDILEFLEKRKSKPKHKHRIRKLIGLIKNMSKARIGTVIRKRRICLSGLMLN